MPSATLIHFEKSAVISRAHNQWHRIHPAVLGHSASSYADANHKTCPHGCGGDNGGSNPFRFDDKDGNGSVYCNRCGGFFNGFLWIEHCSGWSFDEALYRVGQFLGMTESDAIKPGKGSTSTTARSSLSLLGSSAKDPEKPFNPAEGLTFSPWSILDTKKVAESKPGCTLAAIKLAGGRKAEFVAAQISVAAFPIRGKDLTAGEPTGHVIFSVEPGHKLNDGTRSTEGAKSGYINEHALAILADLTRREDVRSITFTEGPSDLVALLGLIPKDDRDTHLVLTNSNGCTEGPKPWIIEEVLNCPNLKSVNIIRDRDKAGTKSAIKWCKRFCEQITRSQLSTEVRNVVLPYTETESHGKDLRDWISDGNDYAAFVAKLKDARRYVLSAEDAEDSNTSDASDSPETEATASTQPHPTAPQVPATISSDYKKRDAACLDFSYEEKILAEIQLEVLGEISDSRGQVKVFSQYHGKSDVIVDVARLSYDRLLQICGPVIKDSVQIEKDDGRDYSLSAVRNAIALKSGARRIGTDTERGPGVYRGANGHQDEIVVVRSGTAVTYSEASGFAVHTKCHVAGLTADIGAPNAWFDIEILRKNIDLAGDVGHCEKVIQELIDILSQWKWRHQSKSPTVVAALILSAWVQAVWPWRPQVAIIGQSNSGKSTFFLFLEALFGGFVCKSSGSSAAGISQTIGNASPILLIDEFEASRYRMQILEMIRAFSRGDSTLKGTPSHRANSRNHRAIAWTGSTESGLILEQDANRFIVFELLLPSTDQHGKLTIPPTAELERLGQQLLGIAVRHAVTAISLFEGLKRTCIKNVNSRAIENFAVPTAIMSAAMGVSLGLAKTNLEEFCEMVLVTSEDEDETGIVANHNLLIGDILSSTINVGQHGLCSVSQSISWQDKSHEFDNALERCGLGIFDDPKTDGEDTGFFIACGTISRSLLKGTRWEGQNLNEHLIRIKNSRKIRKRIGGGTRPYGILIPFDYKEFGDLFKNNIEKVVSRKIEIEKGIVE